MEGNFVEGVINVFDFAGLSVHIERMRADFRDYVGYDEFINGVVVFGDRIEFFLKRTEDYFGLVAVGKYTVRARAVFLGKRGVNLPFAFARNVYLFKVSECVESLRHVRYFFQPCGKFESFEVIATRNRVACKRKAYEFLFALGHSESDFGKVLTINESLFRHFGDAGGYDYFGEPRLIEVTRTESRNAVRYRIRAGKYRRSRDEFRLAGYLVVIEQRSVDRHISGVGNGRSPCGSVNRIRLYLRTTVECSRRDERYGIGYVDLNQIFEILESIFADRNDLFTVVRGGYGQFGEF